MDGPQDTVSVEALWLPRVTLQDPQTTSLRTNRASQERVRVPDHRTEPGASAEGAEEWARLWWSGRGWRWAVRTLPAVSPPHPIPKEAVKLSKCKERISLLKLSSAQRWSLETRCRLRQCIRPTSAGLWASSLVPCGQEPLKEPSPKRPISFPRRYDKIQQSEFQLCLQQWCKQDNVFLEEVKIGGPGLDCAGGGRAPRILFCCAAYCSHDSNGGPSNLHSSRQTGRTGIWILSFRHASYESLWPRLLTSHWLEPSHMASLAAREAGNCSF